MVGTVIAKVAGSSLGATYTMPAADGASGEFLKTDGSTNLSFGSAAAGGKVLQCIQVTKDTEWTVTGTTMTDITGMTATITPSVATSKILVMVTLNAGGDNTVTHFNLRTFRDAVQIAMGAASGSRLRNTSAAAMSTNVTSTIAFNWLDDPSTTSATVYKLQACANNAGAPVYINRSKTNTDNVSYAITVSGITLMEIGV
jgi:hypothetical protein